MKPILLFDIDGTLLHVKRKFLRDVIDQILLELGIRRSILDGMSFAGRTDKDIFSELVKVEENTNGLFDRVKNLYIAHMQRALTHSQLSVIEGATEVIEFARNEKLKMGLCTGNFKEVAYTKVKAAGFDDTFQFGGFGCNHRDRIYLPQDAHMEYESLTGVRPVPENYIVIGDTPNDVRCARYFGAKSVAVTTGGFSRVELEKHNPDLVLDHLGDTENWLPKLA